MEKEQAQRLISKVLPSFKISGIVGKGSFGSVYKIKDELKERVVKMVPLSGSTSVENGALVSSDSKIERDFRHIVESYERIACNEIVSVYDFYMVRPDESDEGGDVNMAYALIIMEIYPTSLDKFVIGFYEKTGRPMDMAVAKNVIQKIAVMVANLYTKTGFLFEDFKPENILVKEHMGDLKLVVGDIGGLKNVVSIALTASQVTPSYCAPEIIRKAQVPDIRSIIYSYGLLSYFVLEGHLPYEDQSFNARFDLVRDKGLPFTRADIPADLKAIIENCVSFEPEQRCNSFDEVVQWLKGNPPAHVSSDFEDGTITVNGSRGPASSDFSAGTIAVGGKTATASSTPRPQSPTGPGAGVLPRMGPATIRAKTAVRSVKTEAASHLKSVSITEEKAMLEAITKDVKGLVVRKGDSLKINNRDCRVHGNIIVESNAVLSINNSKLFFAENTGIIAMGALRIKDSLLSAIDHNKRWNNVTLYVTATAGISIMENTRVHFGFGLSGKRLKEEFNISKPAIADNAFYGGSLFIAGGNDKNVRIRQLTLYKSSAQEGGGVYMHRSKCALNDCLFDGCTAKGSGGALFAFESEPVVNRSTFNKCSAAKDGGGSALVSCQPKLNECMFLSCMCKYQGGGIACLSSNGAIARCRFEKCTAMKAGGGIYTDAQSKVAITMPSYSACKPDDTSVGGR